MTPPRVHFFLWLLSQNRLLTRDNLQKRRDVRDPTCLFCAESETISHLFFNCCVAVNVWRIISDMLSVELGCNYESVARFWIANKKHLITNVISSVVLWSLWKLRNELCFQGMVWIGMKMVLIRITRMLGGWLSLYKKEVGELIEGLIVNLEELSRCPARIEWREEVSTESTSSLVPLGSQPLADVRSDLFQIESCHKQLDQTVSTCMHCA